MHESNWNWEMMTQCDLQALVIIIIIITEQFDQLPRRWNPVSDCRISIAHE